MSEEIPQLIRHGKPNKYDHAAYGTLCKVIIEYKESELYKQVSTDPENPIWEYQNSLEK